MDNYIEPLGKVQRRVDMDDWTRAVNMAQAAERPSRLLLLGLYDSLLKDSHTAGAMESRVLRVVRSRFKLVDEKGKDRPEHLPLFETRWFEQFLQYAAEAEFRGHTLIELGELADVGRISQVYRIDQRVVLPREGLIVKTPGDEKGISFREGAYGAYMIEVGRPDDLGLLESVAPVVIFKKYALGSWSEYTEKFGIPARWINTVTTDSHRYGQLRSVMEGLMARGWAILQGDEKLEIAPTPGTDAHKVFQEFISVCNSEVSKRFLGQDGTSDNKDASGTYGSLRVLQDVAEVRHQADKARIRYLVNDELFPRLVDLGYPLKGIRFAWDEFSELSPKDLVDSVQKLSQYYEVDPEFIQEKTGIRVLGFRRLPGEQQGGGDQPAGGESKGDPGASDEPDRGQRRIGSRLSAEAWPPWKNSPTCCSVDAAAGPQPIGDAQLEQALRLVFDERAEWTQPYFDHVHTQLREGLLSGFGHELRNLSYSQPDHVARTLMEANLFRFSAAKTLAMTQELNRRVTESTGWADFKRRADDVLQVYEKDYLKTEYDLAVATGLQSSRYYEMQRSKEALPFWEYITAGDDQVRPAHAALDGKVFRADDPIWGRIYPPNGWHCRCTVLPRADAGTAGLETRPAEELLGGEELARMKKQGFDQNRAQLGMVFDLNNAYRKELGEKAGQPVKMGLKDSYPGRDVSGKRLAEQGLPAPPAAMTEEEARRWHLRQKDTDGNAVITDHAGRPVVIPSDDFDRKLAKGRADLVGGIAEALKAPDEVWFQSGGRGTFAFASFKFYQGQTLKVITQVDKSTGQLTLASWVATDNDSERQGLLVKPLTER